MDIDNIPYGVNFLDAMHELLNRTDILIAVVGRDWLGREADGTRKIDNETDFVRIEVETALKRGIPVIPVLVANATIPKPEELPESIRSFTYHSGAEVDYGRDFDAHMDRLIAAMRVLLREKQAVALREQIQKFWKTADELVSEQRRTELRNYVNGLVKSADELLSKDHKIEFKIPRLKSEGGMSKGVKYALIGGGIVILLILISSLGGN